MWSVPGVARLALITGLDRSGVEVACAIRPRGHVLSVCNGKGLTAADARRGALLEAAELTCAEAQPSATKLLWGTRQELVRLLGEARVWSIHDCGSAGNVRVPELSHDGVWMAWVPALELFSGQGVWVPAQAIYCPPPEGRGLGPSVLSWSTNGMGASDLPERAVLHALLEATERSELARALPGGWTRPEIRQRRIEGSRLPRTRRLVERLGTRGLCAHLFDVRPRQGAVGVPVMAALLVDEEQGPVPLTAGYACRWKPDDAALAALLEAAQSRLTEIHGAREDVVGEREDVAALLSWLSEAPQGRAGELRAMARQGRAAPPPVRLKSRAATPPVHATSRARASPVHLERRAAGAESRGPRVPWAPVGPKGFASDDPQGDAGPGRGWMQKQLRVLRRHAPLRNLLHALEGAGFSRAAVVYLEEEAPVGVTVAKVIVPGFRCSELL